MGRIVAGFLALALAGCPAGVARTAPSGGARTAAEAPRPPGHASLRAVEAEVRAAAGAKDHATVAARARAIAAAADAIPDEAPRDLEGGRRLRFEGLAALLDDRARALEAAAKAPDATPEVRALDELSAVCVRCHSDFGIAVRK